MDAAEALADLTERSTQVQEAVVLTADGTALASSLPGETRGRELADAARLVLEEAARVRPTGGSRVTALEAAMQEGSLFVASGKTHVVAATTGPEEPAGLVLYDLRACLRALEGDE